MKCEKCGKDASLILRSGIDGRGEEHCLCAGCAAAAGFDSVLGPAPDGNRSGPRQQPPDFDGIGLPLWGMMALSLPRFRVFVAMPRTGEQESEETEALSEAEAKIPADAGPEVRALRETEALRQQLREAVAAEDYETAITLRDRLKGMDA